MSVDDEMLMKEIREHINDIASEFGQDGVSYILVKDKLVDKYVLFLISSPRPRSIAL